MKKLQNIAIHSAPRSGSSWLATIFDSSEHSALRFQPLFSFSHKGQLHEESTAEEIEEYFDTILNTSDEFVLQTSEDRTKLVPAFDKKEITHLVYKEVRYHYILKNLLLRNNEIKVIGMVRNPLATLWSWQQAPKEFRTDLGWLMEDEWRFAPRKNLDRREEYNGYEKWKEVALMFHELKGLNPNRFTILRYDDLIRDTEALIRGLFDWCGLKLSGQTLQFIKESRNSSVKDAYGVYKIRDKDNLWINNLSDKIVHYVREDLKGSLLENYLD
jgi:hypothetical protein